MTAIGSKNSGKSTLVADRDALAMLKSDHQRVTDLFAQYEKTKAGGSRRERGAMVQTLCSELRLHSALEEEIFYPAVRKAIHDDDLMDEAQVEHAGAKELIHQLEGMKPDDERYDAKVTVLGEYIRHHVKEEEGRMFPKARKTGLDLDDLGSQMLTRKMDLMQEAETKPSRR